MDENSQQVILELTEAVRALNETVAANSNVRMANLTDEQKERLKNSQTIDVNTKTYGKNTTVVDESTRAYQDHVKAAEEYNKVMQGFAQGLKTGTEGVKTLFKDLISQDPSRSMAKYGKGLDQLSDAVTAATKNLGPFGQGIGLAVQGLTKMFKVQSEQFDLLHKANDQIAKLGTAGSFTVNELREMANAAGVTSKNMDVLVKPIQSLGPALIGLGKNTGDGVKAFGELAKISNEQRERFQRMGVSQEELIQNQADYLKLQQMSGKSITNELKDKASLQRASLEYTENLLVLANLSGQDAESLKKKQQDAAKAVEAQVAQIQLENKARRLEAQGRTEEAAAIRKEAEGRRKSIEMMAGFDEGAMKGVREFLSTGTMMGDEAQALGRLGLTEELKKLKAEIAAGGDAQKATAKFQDAYNKAMMNAVDKVGFSASRSTEVAKAFNITENSLEKANAQRDVSVEKELEASRKRQKEAQKPGKDPAQDARAKLTTLEIEAGKAMDKLVGASNILTGGFTLLTVGATAAGAALMGVGGFKLDKLAGGLAQKGLDAVKGARGGLGIGGIVPGGLGGAATTAAGTAATGATSAATAATSAASALSKLSAPLSGLAKRAPMIGTVLSVGEGVIDAYQGIKKADKDLKEGKLTKEEARVEKGEAVGGGVGTAAGGAGGAWAGAAAGAALGSAVPVVGTIIGGLLGAALGGWLGSKGGKAIGEVAGGSIAKMNTDADAEFDKQKAAGQSAPKAAVGGVFEGPKSGYPVELHGKEAVVPLGTGTKIGNLSDADEEDDEPRNRIDWEEESEEIDKFGNSIKESDTILKKFTSSVIKLNEHEEKELKDKEDDAKDLDKVQSHLKNVFSSAAINLDKFSKKITITTEGAGGSPVQTGSGGVLTTAGGAPVMAGGAPSRAAPVPARPPSEVKQVTEAPKPGSMGEKVDTKAMQSAMVKELGGMGITDPKAQANILAQVKAESGFKPRSEEIEKYSAKTLFKLYGPGSGNKVRFNSLQEAQAAVDKGPEAVGDIIYGGRMGNTEVGEGYKYRGRGLIQLTGKSNYEKYGKLIGIDLVKDPDLANDPAVAAKLAAVYFKEKEKRGVDLADIGAVGKSVGYAGGTAETQKRAQYAKAYESELQQARSGGSFEGPDTGYVVELHGNETVIPTDKIASVTKSTLDSVVGDQDITETDAWKKLLPAGMSTDSNLDPTTASTPESDIGNILGDQLKDLIDNNTSAVTTALQELKEEIKSSMENLVQQILQNNTGAPEVGGEGVLQEIAESISELVDKVSEGNTIQDKILQYSKV